jgi:hypothetical protein
VGHRAVPPELTALVEGPDAFAPNRIPAAPAGIKETELVGRFDEWRLVAERPDTEGETAGPLRNVPRTWYRLVRD